MSAPLVDEPSAAVVHDTARDFYRDNGVNPGRTGCDLALKAEEMISETRRRLSEFFNPSLVAAGKDKDPDFLPHYVTTGQVDDIEFTDKLGRPFEPLLDPRRPQS